MIRRRQDSGSHPSDPPGGANRRCSVWYILARSFSGAPSQNYEEAPMRKILLPLIVAAICLIPAATRATAQNTAAQDTTAQNAQAQTHEPPAVMQIIRESVKEGRSAAHEKVESDWAAAFRKRNISFHSVALTSMTGPSEAWFLVGYPSFAAVEQANQETQKPGFKAEMDMLEARD